MKVIKIEPITSSHGFYFRAILRPNFKNTL